jgi:hypothetical protein
LKKKSRIQIACEIIAQVKRGMQLQPLTEPVCNGFLAQPEPVRNNWQPILSERAVRALSPAYSWFLDTE